MSDVYGGDGYDPDSDDQSSGMPWYPAEDPLEGQWDARWIDEGEPGWWGDDTTLYNNYGEPIALPAESWYDVTLENNEVTNGAYGMDVLDIIHQLEDLGMWDSEDWDYWRESYSEG